MANAKIIDQKAQHVKEVKEKISKAQSIVFFDYTGLSVEEVTALRKEMRANNIEYVVLKNAIVERAAKDAGIDDSVLSYLKGPNAFAFGNEDAAAPAKILKETVKKLKKCSIKGGIINGAVSTADDMNTLADLPSREQLIARLLGSMMSPIANFAVVLNQIAKAKEA